jgi:hypothetical protein
VAAYPNRHSLLPRSSALASIGVSDHWSLSGSTAMRQPRGDPLDQDPAVLDRPCLPGFSPAVERRRHRPRLHLSDQTRATRRNPRYALPFGWVVFSQPKKDFSPASDVFLNCKTLRAVATSRCCGAPQPAMRRGPRHQHGGSMCDRRRFCVLHVCSATDNQTGTPRHTPTSRLFRYLQKRHPAASPATRRQLILLLLISGFGVRVPGGALPHRRSTPQLTCGFDASSDLV